MRHSPLLQAGPHAAGAQGTDRRHLTWGLACVRASPAAQPALPALGLPTNERHMSSTEYGVRPCCALRAPQRVCSIRTPQRARALHTSHVSRKRERGGSGGGVPRMHRARLALGSVHSVPGSHAVPSQPREQHLALGRRQVAAIPFFFFFSCWSPSSQGLGCEARARQIPLRRLSKSQSRDATCHMCRTDSQLGWDGLGWARQADGGGGGGRGGRQRQTRSHRHPMLSFHGVAIGAVQTAGPPGHVRLSGEGRTPEGERREGLPM